MGWKSTRLLGLARGLVLLAIAGAAPLAHAALSDPTEIVKLWPGAAPGSEPLTEAESSSEEQSGSNKITIVRNVSVPTMTVFRPAAGKANGTAMLVLPGGAFMALAWDYEGTEVARWLTERGVTAFVLKYRVSPLPPVPGQAAPDLADLIRRLEPKRKTAVLDGSQAIALIRRDAARYGIDPDRIGMMGFSAGAVTTLGVVLEGDPDKRPNFAAPIYGMTMIAAPTVPADAPPLFLAHAQDDSLIPPQSSTQIFDMWSAAKRPAELHIYTGGGHGFGMRPKGLPVDAWPTAFEAWLASRGLLEPRAQTTP